MIFPIFVFDALISFPLWIKLFLLKCLKIILIEIHKNIICGQFKFFVLFSFFVVKMAPRVVVSVTAYCKMVLHAIKYPHCAVRSVLKFT